MEHKKTLTLLKFFFTCLMFWACKEEDNSFVFSYNEPFCDLAAEQKIDSTERLVGQFLATLENKNQSEDLEKLRMWLDAKPCVTQAKILCNSCIKTLPPMSELSISFLIKGIKTEITMDISMGDKLEFRAYH